MNEQKYASLIPHLVDVALQAGKIIMEHYEGKVVVEIKEDASPVTAADLAANDYIVPRVREVAPGVQVVSEEKTNRPAEGAAPFFLIDPLDGTKSFIKKDGQFTVNIGLIENNVPVAGVVYVPAKGQLYYTGEDGHAYKEDVDIETLERSNKQQISVSTASEEGLVVVASKSHLSDETKEYIETLNVKEFKSAGSSLKFCRVAEGAADIYPRFGPTMEWDTAAAHAVLVAAGGTVTQVDGSPFLYGKEDFRNPYFIAKGKC